MAAKDPDLGDSKKKFADIPREAGVKDFEFNSVESRREDEKLLDALREAKPSAFADGFGIRGPQPERRRTLDDFRHTDAQIGSISRRETVPDFPAAVAEETAAGTGASVPNITFICSDATVSEGSPPMPSNKVLVADGKIDGQFPSGMGFGNYTIDLADPSDALIYAGATFNPTTLALTSRFLGVSSSGDFPESRVESDTSGFLYWLLSFTYFDGEMFKVVNVRVGDIYTELIYGAQNGQPALFAGAQIGWLDLGLM